jgi:hypothetical protein
MIYALLFLSLCSIFRFPALQALAAGFGAPAAVGGLSFGAPAAAVAVPVRLFK